MLQPAQPWLGAGSDFLGRPFLGSLLHPFHQALFSRAFLRPTQSRASGLGRWMPIAPFRKEIIMQLASRFASRSPVLRADHPLSDDQIRTVAPSIFADTPHESRSERYSYIPTAAVLT